MMKLLHVGCGGNALPSWMGDVEETRLDIDPGASPHIVGNMSDMRAVVPDDSYDSVFCCHGLEHLNLADARAALAEFRRVLKPQGVALIIVPDLEDVSPTHDPLYLSPAGPISGHDMYFGYGPMARENPHMQHRCGFVQSTMAAALDAAGYAKTMAKRVPDYNLIGVGVK